MRRRRALRPVGRARALPGGLAGQGVWRFYRARGFTFPGRPDSAPPTLAQHDWIHVLADYGSTVESEIEVFGLIARANDDPPLSRCSRWCSACSRPATSTARRRASSSTTAATSRATSSAWPLRLADAMYRGAKIAWHLDDNGRGDADRSARHRLVRARRPPARRRARRASASCPVRHGRSQRARVGVGAGWHLAVPAQHGARSPRPRAEYDSYGAEPA